MSAPACPICGHEFALTFDGDAWFCPAAAGGCGNGPVRGVVEVPQEVIANRPTE